MKNILAGFRLKEMNKSGMIKLMSELLLHLDNWGWEPLTPVNIGDQREQMRVTICFKYSRQVGRSARSGEKALASLDVPQKVSSCSVEFTGRMMIFYNVPATVLADIVITSSSELSGVSAGVVSVLSDYISLRLPIISRPSVFVEFLPRRLALRSLPSDVIGCFSKAGYNLSVTINLSDTDSVFFFILDKSRSEDIRQLTKQVAGLGLKDSLTPFQPIVKRRKSSFFRSFNDRASLRMRLQRSLKKKRGLNVEWYQQKNQDCGTDWEDVEDEDLPSSSM